ncbi:MAG: carboxypeptidase regulatory-like domain-containing protein [Sphingobacteriaceae bacterium]
MKKLLYSLVLVFATISVFAQVTTSSLTGSVKDSKGEALIGASVKAIHQPTGTVYGISTNADGRFTLRNMRVGGPYVITITYVGYQTTRVDNISLKLDEPFVLNSTLSEAGTALKEVTITANDPRSVLNADRTGSTTNIGRAEIQRLPTITRNLNDLTRLTPQASASSTGSIGGGNYRQNYITIDGSDFNNTFGIGSNLPAGGNPISLDALEEISVNVTPYDIKQSGFIGSSINAVTRSGTNQFSGSVYNYFRTDDQQGNKVGSNTPFTKQTLDQKTYGFRLGGPIIKDKLFFFANVESYKSTQPGQQNVVSTDALPYGGASTPSNVVRPTAGDMDAISAYLLDKYGYATGGYQGYSFVSKRMTMTGRLDWNINKNHRLNVRYSQVESQTPNGMSNSRSPLTQFSNTNNQGRTFNSALPFENTNFYLQEANFYSLAAELNSTFGNVSNVLRVTSTHQNDPRSSNSSVFPFVDILKDGLPFTSFGYEPFTFGNLRDVRTISAVDYVTFEKGKHNFTLGGQFDISSTKNGFQRFATSYYTFASWDDFVSALDPVEANRAKPTDFAITYSLLPEYAQAFPRFKTLQLALYGQDEISVTDNFKLTAGLRVDMPKFLSVEEIKTHPLVSALTFADGEKINTGNLPSTKLLWSPRLGFNWDVKGDRSLQVRGGTGIFTGRVPTVWVVAQSGDSGLLQITKTYSGSDVPSGTYFQADPTAYRPATVPAAGTSIPSAISAMGSNFKYPQSWKSSIAVDAKLPGGFIGTLEGIFNKDLNVALGRNANLVTPQPLNVAGYPDNRVIYPNFNTEKFINPLISGLAVAPGTTTNGLPVSSALGNDASAFNVAVLDNKSRGYYWSVTAKLEKQFSKGLNGSVAYVMSDARNLYDGGGDQLLNTWSNTQIINSPNDPGLSYANYVQPTRIVASLSYKKEYFKHAATTISLFYEGAVAGRFSYTYSSDFNRDGQTNDLIYIPKDPSEITFVDQSYGSGATAVTYTAKQQSDLFFKYIEQDSYLSAHKGEYAKRNGAKYPWRNQVDFKLLQDVFVNLGNNKKNTIQFSLDIFNFGNFINKNWGIVKTLNTGAILTPRNVSSLAAGGVTRPTFSLAADRNQPVTSTFRDNNSLSSTYYMQFGFRYIFN